MPGCATERASEPPDLGLERPIEDVTGCLIAGVGTFGDQLLDPLVRRINLTSSSAPKTDSKGDDAPSTAPLVATSLIAHQPTPQAAG